MLMGMPFICGLLNAPPATEGSNGLRGREEGMEGLRGFDDDAGSLSSIAARVETEG